MVIDSISDFYSFIIGFIIGILLSFVYDFFKSFRKALKSRIVSVVIEDIIFSFLAAIITFLVLLVRVKGEIRWFVLISELSGFVLYKIYISRYVVNVMYVIIKNLKKHIFIPIKSISGKIIERINDLFDKLFKIFSKKLLKH